MIVLGIDPAIAARKPLACVALVENSAGVTLLGHAPTKRFSGSLWRRLNYARSVLRSELELYSPSLVVIEDSRGVGGRGHALQTLVALVQDWCVEWDVPCVTVNPQTVKAAYGKTKQQVAKNVHLLLCGADQLPRGHDWTDACAIALCGAAQYRREQGDG